MLLLIGTILLTAWILVVNLGVPLGAVPAEALAFERAHALAAHPIGRLVLLALCAAVLGAGYHFFVQDQITSLEKVQEEEAELVKIAAMNPATDPSIIEKIAAGDYAVFFFTSSDKVSQEINDALAGNPATPENKLFVDVVHIRLAAKATADD